MSSQPLEEIQARTIKDLEKKQLKKIHSVISPPQEKYWEKSGTGCVLEHLFSSTRFWVACSKLIQSFLKINPNIEQINFDIIENYFDLEKEITQSSSLNFSHFSIPSFLDSSQFTLPAALDYIINTWLYWKTEMLDINVLAIHSGELISNDNNDLSLYYKSPFERLDRIKEEVGDDDDVQIIISSLLDGLYRYYDSGEALKFVYKNAYTQELNTILEISPEDSLAVICGRVNAFKHQPDFWNRQPNYFVVEWIITSKAIICVSNLWLKMLENTKEDWRD
ncbi:MAG: hypothetical protein ACQ9MH_11680 [Nitrospinales bacterium]